MMALGVILRWLPAAGWMAVIYYLSSLPSVPGPPGLSYVAHFLAYAILALALVWPLPKGNHWLVAALILASLYGVTDEWHQRFVPGRISDPLDWLTDTVGAATALLFVMGVRARNRAQGNGPSR